MTIEVFDNIKDTSLVYKAIILLITKANYTKNKQSTDFVLNLIARNLSDILLIAAVI